MDDFERRTAKRSRFDQTEPEPKRASRFDRRSRSPPSKRSEPRDRSPLKGDGEDAPKQPALDAAAAAAAAAARINASLQARKGIQHVDVPPIQSAATPPSPSAAPAKGNSQPPALNGEMYTSDGDYIQDIEVNDLRNRYIVTKGSTQKMIKDEFGADVTTRGSYYPNKAMATAANPPLYLHITSTTKEGLEKAVAKINELINQDLPPLVDERRFRRRDQEQVERDEFGRRKWPEEKIPISLEPLPGFNLRAQVVGAGGAYVKHIQSETRCRVQIKGRGSGYLEAATNQESDEEMFLHVTGPDPEMVAEAKKLCEDLIENVKEQYEKHKERPPRYGGGHRDGGYGGGGRDGGYRGGRDDNYRGGRDDGGYGGHDRGHSGGGGYGGYNRYGSHDAGSNNSPAPAGVNSPSAAAGAADYAAQYAQYYGGQDPYAAYGGYANYVAMYQAYYQQAQPGAPGAAPGTTAPATSASPPPPPPPSESAPPPPPPPPGV